MNGVVSRHRGFDLAHGTGRLYRRSGRTFFDLGDRRQQLVHHIARHLQVGCNRLQHHPQQRNMHAPHHNQHRQGHALLLQHGFGQGINHQ